MPRFYMHFHSEGATTRDEEGYDVEDLAEMRAEAIWASREMMAADLMKGKPISATSAFEITDEDGQLCCRLRFEEALDGSMPLKRLRGFRPECA